jgi:hypothetical protein
MKNIVLLLMLLPFTNIILGQNFDLFVPNTLKLKKQISKGENTKVIKTYLKNNYNEISKKYDLKYFEWENSKICSYKQNFENGIKYSIFQCKESGGVTIELEFPKIERKKLMKWIEKIYEVDKMETEQNIWKENNSKFEPKEVVPGCYYKIEEIENTTFVNLFCGC